MLPRPCRLAVLAVLLSFPFAGPARAQRLTTSEEIYLEQLLKGPLFDPRGAERAFVLAPVRTVWGQIEEKERGGWLVPGEGGEPDRIYFTDGESTPVTPGMKMSVIDFRDTCKDAYTRKELDPEADSAFGILADGAVLGGGASSLSYAAWLYRFGDKHLAALALAHARTYRGNPREELRSDLAWWAFGAMVHAYMVRADEEALSHGERLLRLYPEEAGEMDQAGLIVEDLKRRQREGTFGKPQAERPDGFDTWDTKRKTAWLIGALDEVAVLQDGSPGGVDLASAPAVQDLIRLGDVAVPDLLDALETDPRLTRSVHFWRDYDVGRTVLSVREAVLTALMSILRIQAFEASATGDNFTAHGERAASSLAQRLRAYWEENGGLSLDERMMKTLADPKAGFKARSEAAANLAKLTEEKNLRTTIEPTVIGPELERKLNPAIAKFSRPTVAEAILAAMDSDLAAHDAIPPESRVTYHTYERRLIVKAYRSALIDLGDLRIAPELARRATSSMTAENLPGRWQWAQAAHFLGDPQPFRDFAEDFRAGRIAIPPGDGFDDELREEVEALIDVGSLEASRALDALAEPEHPYYGAVVRQILSVSNWEGHLWFRHPYCLRILRRLLDDTTPSGAVQILEGSHLSRIIPSVSSSSGPAPHFLATLASPRKEIQERTLDAAALQFAYVVLGAPRYHPLLEDGDERLAALKAALDRYADNFRPASRWEASLLSDYPGHPQYLPGILPLGRAATAADVAQGKAVFHLDGKGRPAALELPVAATLKSGLPALIVQAETGPDGEVTYGVITREAVLTVAASEVEIRR
ncbi:MAG: hypothetical protein ACJ76J_18635 [Thermoanaerobaculia bacterium]